MKLQIKIDGKTYKVEVELVEEEEALLESREPFPPPMAPSPAMRAPVSPMDSDPNICRSPVTGLAIKVNAQPGQAVEADEVLLVLESMKMETNVTAPRAATVKAVHVNAGDPVKLGQTLVEFDPPVAGS